VKFSDYKKLLENKKCPKCGSPVSKEMAGFTGDAHGWEIEDYFFKVTMYVSCTNCHTITSFRSLGIYEMGNLNETIH
jgi:hypothetical protein